MYVKPLFWPALGDYYCYCRTIVHEDPRQTSIDKINDPVMKSERNALIRVSDPLECHSAHTSVGDMWRGRLGAY